MSDATRIDESTRAAVAAHTAMERLGLRSPAAALATWTGADQAALVAWRATVGLPGPADGLTDQDVAALQQAVAQEASR